MLQRKEEIKNSL